MELDYFRDFTRDGVRTQVAHATSEFWAKWRFNKGELANIGISLNHENDDLGRKIWLVTRKTRANTAFPEPIKVQPFILRDKSKLLPDQVPAVSGLVASLLSNGVALDASDTGTGKTYTSLKTAIASGYQPAIICTKTGIYDWKIVCKFFGVTPVFIYNWESCIGRIYKDKATGKQTKITQPPNKYIQMSVHSYTGQPEFRWLIPPNAKVVLIFDEIHKAGGNGTSQQKIVRSAQVQGYKIMGLSATACDKITKFRMLGSLLGMFAYEHFNQWLKDQGCFLNNYNTWEAINEKDMMLKISKFIFPNYGVRMISKVPVQNIAKLYQIEKAELQNKKYDAMCRKVEILKAKGEHAEVLVQRMRFRQVAEFYKIPLLVDLAREKKDSGHSVVIFTCFVDTLEALAKKLKTTCVIKGGQKPEVRRKNINDFQADKERILITNIQAGGTGLSLHDLNGNYPRISLIPPVDDAKLLKQALGRIARSGQLTNAINYLVYSAGTVEVKVYKNVNTKIHNINLLNDGDLAESITFKKEQEV